MVTKLSEPAPPPHPALKALAEAARAADSHDNLHALPISQEAVDSIRAAAPDSGITSQHLAFALEILGNNLARLGRDGDALTVLSEAVDLQRGIAEGDHAAEPFLASMLDSMAHVLSALGRSDAAWSAYEE